MVVQVCPLHADDVINGTWISDDVGWQFTCSREDHVHPGPYSWFSAPPPPPGTELSGLAEELGLGVEIPSTLSQFAGRWIEYGVFEHAYAVRNPEDWAYLVDRYGHRAKEHKKYTASAFLGSSLGNLSVANVIEFRPGPATGRWSYNGTISWWALSPRPDWEDRLSWADSGLTVHYVPGQTEIP